jgi:hypothetical protein
MQRCRRHYRGLMRARIIFATEAHYRSLAGRIVAA